MTVYIVTRVRKALSVDGTHRHLSEVCTQGTLRFTLQEVVESIRAGNTWKTLAGGYEAVIEPVERCPHPGCSQTPYVRTNPDGTTTDKLENLELC